MTLERPEQAPEQKPEPADAPGDRDAPLSQTDTAWEGRTHPSLPAVWIVGGMTAFRPHAGAGRNRGRGQRTMSRPVAALFALAVTIAVFVARYLALMHPAASTIPPLPQIPGYPG